MLDADRPAQPRQVEPVGRILHQRPARRGVLLGARHRGGPVVQDNHRGEAAVVDDVDEPCYPGVDEGGISDDRDDFSQRRLPQRLLDAERIPDGGAHADAGVHPPQRGQRRESVAADVPRNDDFQLGEDIKQPAVRTARAEVGGAGRNFFPWMHRRAPPGDPFPDDPGVELADEGNPLLPLHRYAQRLHVRLDVGIELLNDHEPRYPRRELADEP